VEGGQETCDGRGDFARAEHADLDAGGWEVGGEVVEGAAQETWVYRLKFGDAEGGLDGKRGDGGGAVEAMSGEGLEVGGDAGAGGGIVACDGEEGGFGGGRNGQIYWHGRATHE